jgi:hypothetical protein
VGVWADTGLTLADSRSLDSLVSHATTSGNFSESYPPSPPICARMRSCARTDAWRWYGMGRSNGVDVDDEKSASKVKLNHQPTLSPKRLLRLLPSCGALSHRRRSHAPSPP